MLGKAGRIILIISAYRVSQKSLPGPTTAYAQQYQMLLDKDYTNLQPRAQFIKNLTLFIQEARERQKQIILALDANKELIPEDQQCPKNSTSQLVQETGLQDVYNMQHDIIGDTSRTSNTKIDHVLISTELQSAVKYSGFLPWNQVMESDHRTVFVDFDKLELLGENTQDLTHNTTRQLSTDYPESIDNYLIILKTKIKSCNLSKAIHRLKHISARGWNEQHEKRYNKIDEHLTQLMLLAEKKFVPNTTHPSMWSTKLEEATRGIQYWNMRILGHKKNKINQELLNIEQVAGNVTDDTTTLKEAQDQRNKAWRPLRFILKDHKGQRLKDLQNKIHKSLGQNNLQATKEYTQLIEKEKDTWRGIKSALDRSLRDPLATITIPGNTIATATGATLTNPNTVLTTKKEVENAIIEKSICNISWQLNKHQ